MCTGEVIKYLRKRDNLTQQALAERLGVKKSSIQKYESGSVQNLKLETLQNLCKIFQVVPYAFVFPESWVQCKTIHGGGPDFYKCIAIYTTLTDEGKQKILDYIEDIGEIDRYVKKDIEHHKEIQKLFIQI